MINDDVISMPDKWEYPWYAAWDLAFHTIALSTVDVDFAKEQLELMLQEFFLHPTGQIPAYEWNFSDVNPPVHAWATIFLYRTEQALYGEGDIDFLKRSFAQADAELQLVGEPQRPLRQEPLRRRVSSGWTTSVSSTAARRCPPAATWSRPTARPGSRLFCQNMAEISRRTGGLSIPPTKTWPRKFLDHFLWIASAMNQTGPDGMWDEEGRVLLRRVAASRWQRDPAEGPLHGGLVAAVRHCRYRALAARTGAAGDRAF